MSSLGGSETSYQDMNKITTLFVTATVVIQDFVVTARDDTLVTQDETPCTN